MCSIRIKDETTLTNLNYLYEKLKSQYGDVRNNFLCECLKRGSESIAKDIYSKVSSDESTTKNMLTKINENLNSILELQISLCAKTQALLAMIASNQEMLIGLSEQTPKLSSMIEQGFYDKLPSRIEKLVNNTLKNYGVA